MAYPAVPDQHPSPCCTALEDICAEADPSVQMFGEQDEDDPFITKNKDTAAATEITKLYGDWQTDEWIPPKAEHGIVPKNERGNVLCPPLAYALPLVRINIYILSINCHDVGFSAFLFPKASIS